MLAALTAHISAAAGRGGGGGAGGGGLAGTRMSAASAAGLGRAGRLLALLGGPTTPFAAASATACHSSGPRDRSCHRRSPAEPTTEIGRGPAGGARAGGRAGAGGEKGGAGSRVGGGGMGEGRGRAGRPRRPHLQPPPPPPEGAPSIRLQPRTLAAWEGPGARAARLPPAVARSFLRLRQPRALPSACALLPGRGAPLPQPTARPLVGPRRAAGASASASPWRPGQHRARAQSDSSRDPSLSSNAATAASNAAAVAAATMPKQPNPSQASPTPIKPGSIKRVSLSLSKISMSRSKTSLNQSRTALSRTTSGPTEIKGEKGSHTGKSAVQVFDLFGKDVTPRPLFRPDPHFVGSKKASKLLVSQDGSPFTSEITASYTVYQNTVNPSVIGQFTRSAVGSSTMSKSSISTTESLGEELEEPSYRRETLVSYIDMVRKDTIKELTKEDLEVVVDIYLSETETLWLFNMPTLMYSVECEEAEKIKARNIVYDNLCRNRAGNDLYVERIMQTFNGAPKNKEVQCEKILTDEKGIMSTTWALYDAYHELEVAEVPMKLEAPKQSMQEGGKKEKDLTMTTDRTSRSSSTIDVESVILAKIHEEEEDMSELILKSDKFAQDLFFMERILMENVFQPKLAAYRQLPILQEWQEDAEESYDQPLQPAKSQATESTDVPREAEVIEATEEAAPPNLEKLWSFSCELTKGQNVSSMAWNKMNPDLLAVGYGHFGFKEQKRGLACCWSLKNPMWPERVYPSLYGVTSVDFSIASPNLLAVGYYNGTIAIYNVQSNNKIPVLDSSESPHKHIGPVWQLQWVEQDRGTTGDEKREILITVGADGRITKWIIQKGLICHDLMKLKRTTTDRQRKQNEREKKGEALISRQAPGMCFAFHPKDTNLYLAGTEEGHIHKCSCSYNEQYLDTYKGHKGPVYRLAWNPFCHHAFLSCSADWGVSLWHQDNIKPFLSFYNTTNVIYDIAWSPKSSYIFAAANETRAEIWDLHTSILDPIIVNGAYPGVKITTVLFAKNTNCILIGDSEGQVNVYELKNMPVYVETGRVDAIDTLLGPESYSM
ncbi:dynein axonemal intermediate chain 4 [Gracilinanus agilis]|uniref:dynein axonemal intermediate chain 4 n=1 Tax=Gracilinanus agilis TaxID=191870 RepID=UPI001CFDD9E5|nr:dynein axonemal intermediate chain 4 [Gracilinanus agilis]